MKKKEGELQTAKCKHCGVRGLITRDPYGKPIDKMCVNGHPFEYDEIEKART